MRACDTPNKTALSAWMCPLLLFFRFSSSLPTPPLLLLKYCVSAGVSHTCRTVFSRDPAPDESLISFNVSMMARLKVELKLSFPHGFDCSMVPHRFGSNRGTDSVLYQSAYT